MISRRTGTQYRAGAAVDLGLSSVILGAAAVLSATVWVKDYPSVILGAAATSVDTTVVKDSPSVIDGAAAVVAATNSEAVPTVTGSTLFLRASMEAAGALGTWTDRGTLGANFVQATGGKQPTVNATGGPNNGYRVRFGGPTGGAGTVLECAGDPLGALTACHAFVVMKVDNDPAVDNAGAWKFGTSAFDPQVPYSDGHVYEDWGSTVRTNVGDPAASMASWCCYEVISTSSEFTVLVNGAQVGTTGTNTVDFATTCRIGAADATPTNFMDGDIAEIFQADHKLSAGERNAYAAHVLAFAGITI